jgi:hypothetical protein
MVARKGRKNCPCRGPAEGQEIPVADDDLSGIPFHHLTVGSFDVRVILMGKTDLILQKISSFPDETHVDGR